MQKSDIELIEEIKNGNLDVFNQLMRKYEQQAYRAAFGYVKDQDHAMDIVQNVFIKVYYNLAKFRGDSQFKTWLLRIVFNESHNWMKNHKNIFSMNNIDLQASSSINQEDDYLNKEKHFELMKGLDSLNKKYRMAIILRYFEQFSIKEIADILECSEGVVKNILFRSLQKLKKILQTKT